MGERLTQSWNFLRDSCPLHHPFQCGSPTKKGKQENSCVYRLVPTYVEGIQLRMTLWLTSITKDYLTLKSTASERI